MADYWYQEGDLLANGVRLHYYRTGGSLPPVVLCHGFSAAGLVWERLARTLAPAYDVVMPDARCHGRSEAPPRGNDLDAMAADLRRLLAALGLERPALVGASMGAACALQAAAEDPALARCLVLVDPPWRPTTEAPSPARRQAAQRARRTWITRQHGLALAERVAELHERYPLWQVLELERYAEALGQLRPSIVEGGLSGGRPWRESLARLRCPALLVTGDPARGALVSPALAAEARAILPTLHLAPVAAAGHTIAEDQPEILAALVRDFIAAP